MSASLASSPGASRPTMLAGHHHSAPLKYANAEDLPSYPSPGLKPGDAAASAAATLGWANSSSTASPASPRARLGSLPAPQPIAHQRSQDALLAAGLAQGPRQPPPSPPSDWGPTAANLAFRTPRTPPPIVERPELSKRNSMSAAKGAMASSSRPRARSSPQSPPERDPDLDHTNSGAYALSAATIAHQPSLRPSSISVGDAGAVPYTTMDRQMYTSNPPVKPETDERNRAYVLHASALAMAKTMYEQQQKMIDSSTRAHARSLSLPTHDTASISSSLSEDQPPPLVDRNLQAAAYRLAQERLAKLQEEHDRQRGLQDYYGSPLTPQQSKFSNLGRKLTRKRSSSDGDVLEDQRRSEQIRKQMSLLNNKLSAVDEEKRARDQEALLATAQRNVKAQLQEMDQKVQSEKRRSVHSTPEDWGRKAKVAAQARFDNHESAGKVDIGGGKLMDRSEVESIATKNVQPLLDEINDRAAKEKERLEGERLEKERQKEVAEREKRREEEVQEIHKQLKDQQKDAERARKAELKQQEKAQKAEAKAHKAEQKQAAKEERHKEHEANTPPAVVPAETEDQNQPPAPAPPPDAQPRRSSTIGRVRALSINFTKRPPRDKSKSSVERPPSAEDDHPPPSPTGKMRAWLLSRFARPRSKSTSTAAPPAAAAAAAGAESDQPEAKRGGFIGGAALARLQGKRLSTPASSSAAAAPQAPDETAAPDAKGKGKEREVIPALVLPSPGTTTPSFTTAAAELPTPSPSMLQQQQQQQPDSSMHEVAMAGRDAPTPPAGPPTNAAGGDEQGESSTSTAPFLVLPQVQQTSQQQPVSSQVSQASIPVSAPPSARSVSSLTPSNDGDDEDDDDDKIGRPSVSTLDGGGGNRGNDDDDEEGSRFVEARSEPSGSVGSAGSGVMVVTTALAPPPPPVVPQLLPVSVLLGAGRGVGVNGRASPFRESRFSEDL